MYSIDDQLHSKVMNNLNAHKWSPLFYAGERKKVGIIKTLLENGAGKLT